MTRYTFEKIQTADDWKTMMMDLPGLGVFALDGFVFDYTYHSLYTTCCTITEYFTFVTVLNKYYH